MTVLDSVLAVLLAVGGWIGDAFESLIPVFWTAAETGDGGSLTFIGVLAVIGVAISVTLLIFNYIRDFLHFR